MISANEISSPSVAKVKQMPFRRTGDNSLKVSDDSICLPNQSASWQLRSTISAYPSHQSEPTGQGAKATGVFGVKWTKLLLLIFSPNNKTFPFVKIDSPISIWA